MEDLVAMTDRPILRLPDARSARRLKGAPVSMPRPRGSGSQGQGARFREEFDRLEKALAGEEADVILRQDPNGIAPERALVFVTAVPITDFIRVAQGIGLEVFSGFDLDNEYELPGDLLDQNADQATPTLYATMPTIEVLERLMRLWRRYRRNQPAEHGAAPWWNLFGMLAELRPWGPQDRLTDAARVELNNRLPFDDMEEVRIELEIWPTANTERRLRWRRETEARVVALGGRIIARSAIDEPGFVYEALLVGMTASTVRSMIENPSAPEGLAILDGLQFVLPQTIAQSVRDHSEPLEDGEPAPFEAFDEGAPLRVVLLDGTPIAGHQALDGGVVIEDIHELVSSSLVAHRRHATSMASLILRGDLETDGQPVTDSRLLAIPVLIDSDLGASSPEDRLFVDLIHVALTRAFLGNEPLAPDAFVVNFSVGIRGAHFAGRISSLARLIDWWADTVGILFVVSAGNVPDDLHIPEITAPAFEDTPVADRHALVADALRQCRHSRSLMAPSEAMNALTIGAACHDLSPPRAPAPPDEVLLRERESIQPALSSAVGLGPFRSLKPDLLTTGGEHNIRLMPDGDGIRLRVVQNSQRTGLNVASSRGGARAQAKSRGTSCANALATRAQLSAAAALTDQDGPFEGQELPRRDLALLTRALCVNAARWPDTANRLYDSEKLRFGRRHLQAKEEVARYYGHGLLDPRRMQEAPALGSTLVGLGTVRKDGAAIFDMPLPPSLAGQAMRRSMWVTVAWFSPVEPARAKYRLAALEAIAADGDLTNDDDEDKGWNLALKSGHLAASMIKRGTVWSRRLVHNRVTVPAFSEDQSLPIRVQCRDVSGGGLSPDEDIRFAIAVTLELATAADYDIHQEIRAKLEIPLRGGA